MKTLKEIKEYLKEQETEIIESNRGNKYEVVRIDKKLFKKVFTFKSLIVGHHEVNNEIIYPVSWFEKGKRNEVIIANK